LSAGAEAALQSAQREIEYMRYELKRPQRENELLREMLRLARIEKYGASSEAALPEEEKKEVDEKKLRQRPVRTELPKRILEKGLLSDELVVDVITGKMCDHLPLYRQVERMERACAYSPGLSNLSDLMMRAGNSGRARVCRCLSRCAD
jgi:hypothetical protein